MLPHLEKVRCKLADRRGDSMVEALVAILVAVLGATMLATMVMASVNVASRSERALHDAYTAETNLYDAGTSGTASVHIPVDGFEGPPNVSVGITVFESGEYAAYTVTDQSSESGESGS